MRVPLKVSILLNLVLLGGMIFILANQREKKTAVTPVLTEGKPPAPAEAAPASIAVVPTKSGAGAAPFRWSQLVSAKDYRLYIANLRAIGCPEVTIEDIVRGDTGRVFARERSQLALDESGPGPWSRQSENQLVAGLLGVPESIAGQQTAANPNDLNSGERTVGASMSSPDAQSGSAGYPLFMQHVNWSELGFTADQQAAIAQVRDQLHSEMNGEVSQPPVSTANPNTRAMSRTGTLANSEPGDASAPTQQQRALQNADDLLQELLGAQGYWAYEQQQYYAWYQPQVLANAGGGNLTINPRAASSK